MAVAGEAVRSIAGTSTHQPTVVRITHCAPLRMASAKLLPIVPVAASPTNAPRPSTTQLAGMMGIQLTSTGLVVGQQACRIDSEGRHGRRPVPSRGRHGAPVTVVPHQLNGELQPL